MPTPSVPKTIVFVHGLFLNPRSWRGWATFFRARGYRCHTPAYPFHEGEPLDLRHHPSPGLAWLTFDQVVDSMTFLIDRLPEKPILIGHSMGALVVQKLIAQGKGCAGVLINSTPPAGISSLHPGYLWTKFRTTSLFRGNTICFPSVPWFYDAFSPALTSAEAAVEFQKVAVPESRNLLRTSSGPQGQIDFLKPHPPPVVPRGPKGSRSTG